MADVAAMAAEAAACGGGRDGGVGGLPANQQPKAVATSLVVNPPQSVAELVAVATVVAAAMVGAVVWTGVASVPTLETKGVDK